MPLKIFPDILTGWANSANIVDGSNSTFGSISSSGGTPATKQETVEWSTQVFSKYHFINLHVRYHIGLDVVAGGGPDQGTATAHLEYQAGAGFVNIFGPGVVGPTTENGDVAEIEAVIQLPISGNFDIANVDVRADVATTISGSGSADADVNLREVFLMVYLDSTFGGFQPV